MRVAPADGSETQPPGAQWLCEQLQEVVSSTRLNLKVEVNYLIPGHFCNKE
jgi:hypothetical protein